MSEGIPILEFDPEREAVIEPTRVIEPRDLPERCVLTFFREVLEQVAGELDLEPLPPPRTEMGPLALARGTVHGVELGVGLAGVGAPLAGGLLDELIARGARKVVVCGSAGVLLGQMLYGGDDLIGEVWDPRGMGRKHPARETLLRLALEAAAEL